MKRVVELAVVVVGLVIAVPLVIRLSHALVVPCIVGAGSYVVVRVVHYFTDM